MIGLSALFVSILTNTSDTGERKTADNLSAFLCVSLRFSTFGLIKWNEQKLINQTCDNNNIVVARL